MANRKKKVGNRLYRPLGRFLRERQNNYVLRLRFTLKKFVISLFVPSLKRGRVEGKILTFEYWAGGGKWRTLQCHLTCDSLFVIRQQLMG